MFSSNEGTTGKRKIRSAGLLAVSFCMLAGFLASPLLAAPIPSVTLAASTTTPFIGNTMTITATFDNTGPAGDTGYGPFIDLVFPSRGADGPTSPDGISFGTATYMGAPVTTYTYTFPVSGCVTHPLARDISGNLVQVCGQEGDTLVVAVLPFGSFVTDQPPGPVVFTANVSNMADVGTDLTFHARGGFQFGADALNNPITDPSILSQPSTASATWAPAQIVTPQVITVAKTAESGLTGDNFHRQYTITFDIAPGQTINNITVTDTLPSDMVYLGATAAGGSITVAPAIGAIVDNVPPTDNTLEVTYASLIGGSHVITVDFFVPEADYGTTEVIDRTTADDSTSDANTVSVTGAWPNPVDTRDRPGTFTPITVNNVRRTDMSMILDKSVSVVDFGFGTVVIPGAVLQHTLTIGVSDYFAFEDFIIDDTINDGHRWYTDATHMPTLALVEHRGNLVAADMNAANYTVTTHYSGTGGSLNDGDGNAGDGTDGTTDFQFRVSAELITRGTNGKVHGGCVPAGGAPSGVANCGCTFSGGCTSPPLSPSTPPTITIIYYTKIQEYFSDYFPLGNSAVDQGDILNNTATAIGDVLNVQTLLPYGTTEADGAAVDVEIAVGVLSKTLYSLNGVVPPPGGATIQPGDEVTYQITYSVPTHNFENLFLTDYLPLPVFDATEVATFVDGLPNAAVPAAGTAKFGPSDTFRMFLVTNGLTLPDVGGNVYPALFAFGTQNTVTFTYGDFNTAPPLPPDGPLTIDILFTVTVTTDPYANGLLLTNQAQASESSTAAVTTATSAIYQIVLDEPVFTIDKSITASTNPGGVISGGNITNSDAGDVLTFAVTATNIGDAPAYDVTFREPVVAGLGACAVTLVTVNGAPLTPVIDYTGDMFGGAPYLVLTNPVPVDGIVVVTYTCTLAAGITPRQVLINTAYVNWAAGPGAPKFGEIFDTATITISTPAMAKSVFDINPGPSDPNVTTGDVITYQLNVTIPEGSTPGLTITDTLPAGFEYVAGSVVVSSLGSGVTLTNNPPTVGGTAQAPVFNFGDVTVTATGGSANNTFVLRYNVLVRDLPTNSAPILPLQNKTNTASLNYTGNPGGAITDSETVQFGEPIMAVTKAMAPNTNLEAGTLVTITLTITNTGTAPAFDVVVTDTLNEGVNNALLDLTTVAALSTPAGFTYSYASPTVTYTQNDGVSLAPGASRIFTFTANVRADVILGATSTYNNTAAVTGDSQENIVAEDRDTSGTSPAVTVSMRNPAVAKTIPATSEAWTTNPNVAIGEVITYRLTYTLYQGVTRQYSVGRGIFDDVLPAGQQYMAGTATIRGVFNTGISGSTYGAIPVAAAPIVPTIAGQNLGFYLGDITNSDNDVDVEQVIIEFNALVLNTADNNRTQLKTNTGRINYRNKAGTNQSLGSSQSVRINEPNLTVNKTAFPTTASGGETITFTVVVTNTNIVGGYVTRAWELDLSDDLPSPDYGIPVLVSAILSRGPTNVTACGSFTGNTLNFNLNCMAVPGDRYLAPSDTITLTYTAVLDPNIAFEKVVTNAVNVATTSLPGTNGTGSATPGVPGASDGERTGTGGVNDLTAMDNATVTANRPTLTKAVADNTLQVLETTFTTLTIPIPVGQTTSFVVTDDLPAGLSYTGTPIVFSFGTGISSSNIPPIPAPGAGTDPLIFDFGTIQNDGSAGGTRNLEITYEVRVNNVIGNQNLTTLTNTARLSYTGVTLPAPSSSAVITVLEPQLTATKIITAGAAGSNAGDTVSYQTTIANIDPNGIAYRVNLRDVLPAHLLGANGGAGPYFTNITITKVGSIVLNSDGITPLTSAHAVFDTTTLPNDTLTWQLFDMPPNSSLTIDYDVVVTDDAIVGETLTNTITAIYNSRSDGTGRGYDGTALNDYRAQTSRALTLDASIALQKYLTVGQPDANFAIGEEISFDLRVDVLTGVTQNVVVTDVLPAGLDYVSFTGIIADFNISYTGPGTAVEGPVGTITVNMGNVSNDPDGDPLNDYFIVRLRAKVQNILANQSGDTLTDTGSVTCAIGSDSDTEDTYVVEPVLQVTKVADTTAPPLGGTVTYTVTVSHAVGSNSDAYDVTLTDLIPVGLTYVAGSFAGSGTVDDSGLPTLAVDLGSITLAEISKTFSYQVTVDNSAVVDTPLTNTINGLFASITGATGDPDDGRNGEDGAGGLNNYVYTTTEDVTPSTPNFIRAPKTVAIVPPGDLDGQLDPLDNVEYTIVLNNTGTSQATNVVYTDAIPANTTYVMGTLSSTQGTVIEGSPLQVNVGTMNPGATVIITFQATVNPGTPDGTIISNQGLVDSEQTVPRPTDDDDIDANGLDPTDIIVGPPPVVTSALYAEKRVLWLTDADSSGSVTPGDTLRYTIVVENLGSVNLTSVQLDDTIPAGLTYVGGTLSVSQQVPPNASIVGSALSWPIGVLTPGDFASAVFNVTIDDPLPGSVLIYTFTNQGSADSDQTTPVPTDGNGNPTDGYQPTSITAVDGAAAVPDLDVQKRYTLAVDAGGDGVASPGDTIGYQIFITNTGAAAAHDVRLADTIPVVPITTTVVVGSVYTSQGVVLDEDPVSINIGTVNPGQVITVRFRVVIDPLLGSDGIIPNQATVSSTELPDIDSDDNGDPGDGINPTLTPVFTGAGGGVPSGLGKTMTSSEAGSADPDVFIGEVLTFEVGVTLPEGNSWQITFLDTLPAGLTYVAGSGRLAREFDTGMTASENPGGVNSAASGVFVNLTDGVDMIQSGQDLTVFLGDVINSDGDGNTERYRLRYDVVVANVVANQAGTSLLNSARLTYLDSLSQPGTLGPVSYSAAVIEADIQLTKNASPSLIRSEGGTVIFTVVVDNVTGANVGPAYDVRIIDTLLTGYSNLQVLSTTPGGGLNPADVTDNSTSAGLDITVDAFPEGGQLTIIYTADAGESTSAGDLTNTAAVTWTSVPGDYGTGNATPGDPGDPDGERNSADGVGGLNDYTASDNATVNYKPSRRAIRFENTYCSICEDPVIEEHYVTVNGAAPVLDLTTQGTIEAWIKPASFTEDAGIVMKGTANTCYGFGLAGGTLFSSGTPNNIGFVLGNTAGANYVLIADDPTTMPLQAGKWYHISCVWDTGGNAADPGVPGATMAIYINGVLEASSSNAIPNVRSNDENLMLGIQQITNPDVQYFGTLEEFRIWNMARTEDDIRDNMCRTVTPVVTPDPNLPCCLRFDEQGGSAVGDVSGNGNIGSLFNVVRLCSEAPIGDTSDHDYVGAGASSVSLDNLASTETLTASASGGTWSVPLKSGLQVYRVEEAPDDGGSPQDIKLFGDRGYWGVFVTGGSAPTYTVLYNYDSAGIGNENNLLMMFRNYNCQPWKNLDATLNPALNILTQSGLSGTEFILGKLVDPRNAIVYDGTDDYVSAPDDPSLDVLVDTGTLESWIKLADYHDNAGIINKGDTAATVSYALRMGPAGNNDHVVLAVYDGFGSDTITSVTPLSLNIWYHVAGTWDNTTTNTMELYINGVSDQTGPISRNSRNSNTGLNIGVQYSGSGSWFEGDIDEVRVWDGARSQAAIRTTMCKKVTIADVGFANLMGYWRFDEETDSAICPDYSANNNDGTMNTTTPAPGFADIRASRICSSAPIGDDSAYDYNAATSNAILTSGDIFTATGNAGSWAAGSGIHVYRLDEAPVYPPDLWTTPDPPYSYATVNGLTPPAGWSSVDYYRYFGVFLTDWTDAPTYDVIYNYNGNPSVPQNESVVALARRDEYCDRNWVDAVYALNTTTNTLTKTADGQNGPPKENPEYILAGKDDPLAIVLAGFTATVDESGKCLEISWETATEINTIGFQLWRSTAKEGPFTLVSGSFTKSKSLIETQGAQYSYTDCDVVLSPDTSYYYKLEEIDMDNTSANPMYGPIGPIPAEATTSAAQGKSSKDKACFISTMMD